MRNRSRGGWRPGFWGLAAGVMCLAAAPGAHADEITVKGDTLKGKVVGITGSEVQFDTDYGGGTLTIPIADIESVSCDKTFFFVYGDDAQKIEGQLLGIRDGALVVGSDETAATTIPASALLEVYDSEAVDGATGWLREALALWHGSFDVGFSATKSTLDTVGVNVGFKAERKKEPSRVTFEASYRYGKSETEVDDGAGGTDKKDDTTENEVKGLLRGEYDIIPRLYWYGSQDAEYDEIESLSYRLVPKTGIGYRFWDTGNFLFQLESGGAYVYENYFGSEDDGYFAIAFGKLLEWKTPWFGSEVTWKTDYLPAIDDWGNDYLIRSEAALLVPMIAWLKFKVGLSETYNSEPADDSDKNTFASTVGLAATY